MTAFGEDSLGVRRTLNVNGKNYDYFSLKAAEEKGVGHLSQLPFSLKVLIENLFGILLILVGYIMK